MNFTMSKAQFKRVLSTERCLLAVWLIYSLLRQILCTDKMFVIREIPKIFSAESAERAFRAPIRRLSAQFGGSWHPVVNPTARTSLRDLGPTARVTVG